MFNLIGWGTMLTSVLGIMSAVPGTSAQFTNTVATVETIATSEAVASALASLQQLRTVRRGDETRRTPQTVATVFLPVQPSTVPFMPVPI